MSEYYYHNRMGCQIAKGSPFDSLPEDLKVRFIDVFYDGLKDAVAGAFAHATNGAIEVTNRQLCRILEFADNPAALKVLQDVVEELESIEREDSRK